MLLPILSLLLLPLIVAFDFRLFEFDLLCLSRLLLSLFVQPLVDELIVKLNFARMPNHRQVACGEIVTVSLLVFSPLFALRLCLPFLSFLFARFVRIEDAVRIGYVVLR